MANVGAGAGYYLLEMDGVSAAEASEVSGIGIKHENFKIDVGNRPNPYLGRGKYECDEVTIKHAHALNNVGQQMFRWFGDYIKGYRTDKVNIRLVQLGEDGSEIIEVWEMEECVPTAFTQETNKGDSKDASYFMIKLKPTDCYLT